MLIQGLQHGTTYTAVKPTQIKQPQARGSSQSDSEVSGTRLTISDQAQGLVAANKEDIQAKIDAIKTKSAVERTRSDTAFLLENDSRFAQIAANGEKSRTAEDLDYMQKAGGLVNTMANLSPSEKRLYNKLVAEGNTDAVNGMNLIALSRMGSGSVTLPNGHTFDPKKTEVTPQNIRNLFSQMFVSNDDHDARSFNALAYYLEKNPTLEA